jgi:hypothetical protein
LVQVQSIAPKIDNVLGIFLKSNMVETSKNNLELRRDTLDNGLNLIKEALVKSNIEINGVNLPKIQACIDVIVNEIAKVEIVKTRNLLEREQKLGVR